MVRKVSSQEINTDKLDELIKLFEGDNPPTKKYACEYLGITYNTKRLDKLITERKEYLAFVKEQRKKKRGTKIEGAELKSIIEAYLEGEAISVIAERVYRSFNLVKEALEDAGVPIRDSSSNYFSPDLIPDESLQEDYSLGDLAYSVRYAQVVQIKGLAQVSPVHGKVYHIILQKSNKHAYQPWYELASLTKLKFGDLRLSFL